jgi:hypothetical protein
VRKIVLQRVQTKSPVFTRCRIITDWHFGQQFTDVLDNCETEFRLSFASHSVIIEELSLTDDVFLIVLVL